MSEPNFQLPDDQNSNITYLDNVPKEIPQDEIPSHHTIPHDEDLVPEIQDEYIDPDFYNTHLGKRILDKYGRQKHIVNKMNSYGNSIILGSFCYAITYIIYGFHRCKVFTNNETFMWGMILLFGSLGQITAGFLEVVRARHFTAFLYLVSGFYCLSHEAFYFYPKITAPLTEMTYIYYSLSVCIFYSAMVFIYFAVTIISVKTNILFLLQCLTAVTFCLLRAIGEGSGSLHTKRNAAGILQVISGFFSLLVFMSQVINNVVYRAAVFPVVPLDTNNGIDVPPSR